MSQHSTHFEASSGALVLTNAILLYRHRGQGSGHQAYGSARDDGAFATIHAVDHDDNGAPTIAAGRPLTRGHLRQWTEALGRTAGPEILPASILVAHPDVLAWWVPAQVRPAYFALYSPPAGLRLLSGRVTTPVPYPAHLFVASHRGLGVYALAASQRPSADTELLHSPILNVYVDGQLCWGNIARPRTLAVAAIPDFERAVFESWSTHPNPGQELTITGRGGLAKLWDDLAARGATSFPVKRLKPFGTTSRVQRRSGGLSSAAAITVSDVIAASART